MKIVIDPLLKTLSLWAEGDEIQKVTGKIGCGANDSERIYTFRNPKLLTDLAAMNRLPSFLRDAISKLYQFDGRTTEYDGVSVWWSETRYPGVWAPSIDTVVFASALRKRLMQTKYISRFSTLLEIGCGSGFLTKYVMMKKQEKDQRDFNKVPLMDINKDAIKCALDTLQDIRGETEIVYTHNRIQSPLHISHPYDLVLCNPPYIPRPSARDNNPFEGLFLYYEILQNASKLLSGRGLLFITFSSLSEDVVLPEFRKYFSLRPVAHMRVPLKIPSVFSQLSTESKQWVKYLESKKGLEVDRSERSGYRYWERITVMECRYL